MSTASEIRIHRGPWYWTAFDSKNQYAGRDLAALRRGLGRQVGDVPEMWPFYESIVSPDRPVHTQPRIEAEHAALTLFAVHQQSRPETMHRAGADWARLREACATRAGSASKPWTAV